MLSLTFSGDEDAEHAAPTTDAVEPEYVFEGFTIEDSERIMLTPPAAPAAVTTRVRPR